MGRFTRNNGLTLALLGCFAISQIGLSLVGHRQFNDARTEHGESAVSLGEYLRSAHYVEATMENWESEFLQMWAFVMLTVILFQKGSAESKDPDKFAQVDRVPRRHPEAPRAVWRGGWMLALYERSLGAVLFAMFAVAFWLHAMSGARAFSAERISHGGVAVTTWEYLGSARFWFESFQNWQSEFFSVAVLVVATIWLRQRGSAQSKPVDASHRETGGS